MNPDPPNELMCPISLDWLEDPIALPCCGRVVSRESMIAAHQHSHDCPLCNGNLENFNPSNVAKLINIVYLVEQAKKGELLAPVELFKKEGKPKSEWVAKIKKLCNNDSVYQTIIGQLKISNTNDKFNFKTLLIPVIDVSGSMAGAPTTGTKYSLNRIVDAVYKHPGLMTTIIRYSDNAQSFIIDKTLPIAFHRDTVEKIYTGGGTNFTASFTEILQTMKKHKDNPDITSIVIIFLTDGQGSGNDPASINKFKADIVDIWKKPFIVHTVGFGGSHDYNFLNNLRQIGTTEGAYRYADPGEDTDSLSNKINSLLDVIAASSTIPLKIVESPVLVISGDNNKYWLDLTNYDTTKPFELTVSVNDIEPTKILVEFEDDENDVKLWEEWYTYLVDEIANEILMLSAQKIDALDKEIHCELLQQRGQAIMMRIDSTSPNANRLEKLLDSLKTMQKGGMVNQSKLNDMKFEGKYATKSSGVTVQPGGTPYIPFSSAPYVPPKPKLWAIVEKKRVRRCNSRDGAKQPFIVLGKYSNKAALEWIATNIMTCKDELDDNDFNMLMMACCIGKKHAVKALLETKLFDLTKTNKEGYNALDLAIIYGYDPIYDLLTSYGAKPSLDGQLLLRTCLSLNDKKRNIYTRLASSLLKDKIAVITDDMIENCPFNESIAWLSARSSKTISIETAIIKGMVDIVTDQLNTVDKISWKLFLDLFTKPTNEHLAIVDLLLKNKKADPNEVFEITDEDNVKGVNWPLYATCEKGQVTMFKTLLKYIDMSTLNKQNHHGTTCLWIASCNKHIDIVMELLHLGADPNIPNLKGDSALIPCCQKGNDTVAEVLLEAGARLDVFNKERDNPALLCCRTGQARILEMLFKKMKPDELATILETANEIDGFIPLLAAAELDKVECIKLCHKYGANLEAKTKDDNKVIAGATALHLTCHYNRLAAAKTLIDLGADIKSQTNVSGSTPLHIAIRQNHTNLVRYLLSLPQGRECLEISDADSRLPSYYAKNNQEIYEEFFTNKLAIVLSKAISSSPDMEARCAEILFKYGRSPCCFEFSEITDVDIGNGTTLLTQALLNGNKHLITSLSQMNADLDKTDDYGVSANFWIHLLGYDLNGAQLTEQSKKMLDNVHYSVKKNMQNKLLLNIQVGQPKLLEAPPDPMNTFEKMNDGYSLKINDTVVANLKSLKSIDHSLLGFIEKLKNIKVFPEGKNYLEYLLFETKVHVIKLIAAGETKLEPIHLMAIYLHSGNATIFKQINQSLMNFKQNDVWQPFICCLYQGLDLIEPYENESYRAVDIRFNLKEFAIGNKLKWNCFSVASQEWKVCNELINNKKRGIVFIAHSKTGRDISKYAKNNTDKQIIFLPGTEFLITNYYKSSTTALSQANIRTSTYKITEKDIERALNSENCIIIELEEC